MRNIRLILACAVLGIASIGSALADGHYHSSVRVGIGFGVGPYWGPRPYAPYYYHPYPYYVAPSYPVVVTQPVVAEPQVYVEQPSVAPITQAPAQAQTNNYWYYCQASRAYYPYVQDCPGGWQQVVPQPPQR